MRQRPSHQGLHHPSMEEEEEDSGSEEDPFADVANLRRMNNNEKLKLCCHSVSLFSFFWLIMFTD